MNISQTGQYKAWRAEQDFLFAPEYRDLQMDETKEFEDGFVVCTRIYKSCTQQYLTASENELLNCEGHILYTWRNLDTDGEFCTLFRHLNGRHYLIFRIELYGYSVYEVESGKELHYVPSQVHPEEGQNAQEVFIWTSASYNPENNLLAVTGCIWACPFSIIILDFSNPLKEQPAEQWLDIRKLTDPEYDHYNDIDFIRWEKGDLLLRGDNMNTEQWEELRLSEQQLRAALERI